MSPATLQDGLRALVEQYGADTVAAAVALLVSPVKECKRCGHTWTPRTTGTPRQCPGCHSQGWQSPRKTTVKYRTVPAPATGIGWVAVERRRGTAGNWEHVTTERGEAQALAFIARLQDSRTEE